MRFARASATFCCAEPKSYFPIPSPPSFIVLTAVGDGVTFEGAGVGLSETGAAPGGVLAQPTRASAIATAIPESCTARFMAGLRSAGRGWVKEL